MKYLILVFFFTYPLISYSQDKDEMKLIREFYKAFYNESIPPQEIVDRYIQYSDSVQFKTATEGVLNFRNSSDNFLVNLRKDINENNYTISSFSSFSNIDKVKFNNLTEEKRKNIYKVDLKNTISQYLWLDNGKIVSFFGFQKSGYDEYYFIVFQ